MFELTGQTAIVTGAGTGIGEVIATRLAAAGARVAVADIDADAARAVAGKIGGGAFPLTLDVTSSDQVGAAVEQVIGKAGSLEILVNNAGIAGAPHPSGSKRTRTGTGSWTSTSTLRFICAAQCCRICGPTVTGVS